MRRKAVKRTYALPVGEPDRPRPETGILNGWIAIWARPMDVRCLAQGVVTSTIQVEAQAAVDEFLKDEEDLSRVDRQ